VRDAISPAIQRARRAVAGEKVLFNGQERDPRYWYKRETLHGLMEPLIDAELAPTLRAIIPEEVRQERRQARDAVRYEDHYTGAGVRVSHEQKRATARLMRAQGQSLRAIAADLGVSAETIRKWIA
jgi:predicted component of type VI protein secretion system